MLGHWMCLMKVDLALGVRPDTGGGTAVTRTLTVS
jgi:hypothetical protein